MKKFINYKILNYCIPTVWIINGLYCKVLNFVPRHQEIVQKITNLNNITATYLTNLIGFSEILMAIWVLSRYKSKLNAQMQIIVVATMNILEYLLVPNLLLWGKFNSIFAFLFIITVYFNEFYLNKKRTN